MPRRGAGSSRPRGRGLRGAAPRGVCPAPSLRCGWRRSGVSVARDMTRRAGDEGPRGGARPEAGGEAPVASPAPGAGTAGGAGLSPGGGAGLRRNRGAAATRPGGPGHTGGKGRGCAVPTVVFRFRRAVHGGKLWEAITGERGLRLGWLPGGEWQRSRFRAGFPAALGAAGSTGASTGALGRHRSCAASPGACGLVRAPGPEGAKPQWGSARLLGLGFPAGRGPPLGHG